MLEQATNLIESMQGEDDNSSRPPAKIFTHYLVSITAGPNEVRFHCKCGRFVKFTSVSNYRKYDILHLTSTDKLDVTCQRCNDAMQGIKREVEITKPEAEAEA